MAVKVEIFARNLELAEKVKDYITKKASKLDRYLNEIEQVRVDLDYIKSARSTKDRNVAQITVRGHRALSHRRNPRRGARLSRARARAPSLRPRARRRLCGRRP